VPGPSFLYNVGIRATCFTCRSATRGKPSRTGLTPQTSWSTFIRSVKTTKEDLIRSADDAGAAERGYAQSTSAESAYSPFPTNPKFSQCAGTIIPAATQTFESPKRFRPT